MVGLTLTVPRIAEALSAREPVLRPEGAERATLGPLLHPSAEEKPQLLVIERPPRGEPVVGLTLTARRIAEAPAAREPALNAGCAEGAAVALLLHDLGDRKPRLLPIECAQREEDPWPGSS